MLLFKPILSNARKATAIFFASVMMFSAACTVQPLYQGSNADGTAKLNVSSPVRAKLAGITIDQAKDRFSQLVRNHLIFLLGNGAGEPATTTYQLSLNATYGIRSAVQIDIGDDTDKTGRASAGAIDGTSNYVLKDMDGSVLAKRRRMATASFDRPRQEYANLQAEQDAIKRAAEELAEQVFLSLAQDVSKLP